MGEHAHKEIKICPSYLNQACRQGGFEGVCSNLPFDIQKILHASFNCTF